ncbi:MAG: beta-ketoacyl synthase N-terminal-like domain-containing protein [Myxococcota bacterium]
MRSSYDVEPIAIVGIGCRFPGAADPAAYWALLSEGRSAIREVPEDRWGGKAPLDSGLARGGFLEQVDGLDWRALRVGPREANYIDPQHRLALEVAWEALEDAGIPLDAAVGTQTAVVVGVSWGDYQRIQARDWSRLDGYTAVGTPFAFAANRISHVFDLRGPSFSLDATCSSSLAAVGQACHALWSGQATQALAGGVNLMLSPDTTLVMSRAGVLSRSGQCRALDAEADGFVRGEGAGLVVLKPASRVRPDDRVYAWIRGVALNHNGRNEWIMAPNEQGQAQAITEACRQAGVAPRQLQYVELHGTGFTYGDVVEARALGVALGDRSARSRPCAVGSVKTNIGNLESAAGIAGLIKVALSLHHGTIPPTLNLRTPNPEIDFEGWGLHPVRAPQPWSLEPVRCAGVSATSLSGVNAHVVLSSAEVRKRSACDPTEPQAYLLPLSARTPASLEAMAKEFAGWLSQEDRPRLLDIVHTASRRRSHQGCRLAAVGDANALVEALMAFARGQTRTNLHCSDSSGAATERVQDEQDQQDEQDLLGVMAHRYVEGLTVDWSRVVPEGGGCVSLPTYRWQRERMWPSWLSPETIGTPPEQGHGEVPPREPVVRSPESGLRRAVEQAPLTRARSLLVDYVRGQLNDALGLDAAASVGLDQPLFDLGVTSLTAVELRDHVQSDLGVRLPSSILIERPTVRALVTHLLTLVRPDEAGARRGPSLVEPSLVEPSMVEPSMVEPNTVEPSGATLAHAVNELSEPEVEGLLLERLATLEEQMTR